MITAFVEKLSNFREYFLKIIFNCGLSFSCLLSNLYSIVGGFNTKLYFFNRFFLFEIILFKLGLFLRKLKKTLVIHFFNKFYHFVPLREAHSLCNYYQSKNVHFLLEFLCVSLGGYLLVEI